ncbi:hypothetical protein ACFVFS_34315 [Kitasatospora sp. NPDC057692]|uniref:hypothetical protein n=1 Tax=Kitasatospora sp. NPDC057692 TaxID=3346215 RepID=UPI0036ABDCA2
MSDEWRPGADGERSGRRPGPVGESPVECLLREAMAARAARITGQDLRPADPPAGPRARRRPAYLVGLPLLGLAAATVIGLLTVPTDVLADRNDGAPAATTSRSPDPTGGPDPLSPSARPTDALGRPVGAPDTGSSRGSATAPGAASVTGPGEGGPGDGATRPDGRATAPPGGAAAGAPTAPGSSAADGRTVVRPSQDIEPSFEGLAGAEAIVGGKEVAFSVTWRNTTGRPYETVAPVVAVSSLADRTGPGTSVQGRLQREEADGTWTTVPLTEASGSYLASGDEAAFPLAPGAARTVRYRLLPAIDSAEGVLLIEGLALLPSLPQRTVAGSTTAALRLSRAPADAQKAPEFTIEPSPTEGTFTMTVRNPGAAPLASVIPTMVLSGSEASAGITVRARYGSGDEGLRTLPVAPNGSGRLVVDTTLLERLLRPFDSTSFTFSLSVPYDWRPDSGSFAVVVGVEGDGRDAAPLVIHPGYHVGGAP